MEWQFDLLDLLEKFLRVNLVDELCILILAILHLQSKDGQHEEFLLRVSSQVDITWCLSLWSLRHCFCWSITSTLLLDEFDINFCHIVLAILRSITIISADWRVV